MISWREEGVVLVARPHGETSAIAEIFTHGHGRHLGVVRGGAGRRMAPVLQPGEQVEATWSARLEDHLGAFVIEPVRSRAAGLMADRAALAGLHAMSALLSFALPERAAYPTFYDQTQTVMDLTGSSDVWPFAYLKWEMALLEEMGFGLDLSTCAVTGDTEGLAWVSPRTGRAVTDAAAGRWKEQLLALPRSLAEDGLPSPQDIVQGLALTGYFLDNRLRPALGDRALPPSRARLIQNLIRLAQASHGGAV